MARPSLQELDTVAQTFEDAADTCKPAANILVLHFFASKTDTDVLPVYYPDFTAEST